MSKYLYFQDLHCSGKTPTYRTDKYLDSIFLKLEEIVSIAKTNKCDSIISGGDNLDSSIVSLPICDRFIDTIEKGKTPFYTIWGNHEEESHNPELSKSTTLQHMFNRSTLINCLDVIENKETFIQGFSYFHNCEEKIKEKGIFHDKKDKFTIGVVHSMITLKPFHPSVLHVQIKDIKTNYDAVLIGHYHQPWGIKEINNTKFINIGCIGRKSIDEKDIKPSVLLIDTDKREIKIIELKSAKPGKEVFDLEKVKAKKEFEGNINKFMESLDSTELQSIDLIGKVNEIGKNSNTDKEIIDDLVKRVSIAQNKGGI